MKNNRRNRTQNVKDSRNRRIQIETDPIGWILTAMLKFGAGYLTKAILDAINS